MFKLTIMNVNGLCDFLVNHRKISFGGIPNSRNVLFLQIFLKRATQPSAGNPIEPVEPDLALH
jgi:hypothetical protein